MLQVDRECAERMVDYMLGLKPNAVVEAIDLYFRGLMHGLCARGVPVEDALDYATRCSRAVVTEYRKLHEQRKSALLH